MTGSAREIFSAGADHRDLHPLAARLSKLARHLAGTPGPAAFRSVDELVHLLETKVARHFASEEKGSYAAVAEALGSAVTTLLAEDHRSIERWTARLAAARTHVAEGHGDVEELRQALYAVAVLLEDHFAREDIAYGEALHPSAHHLAD